MSANRLSHPGRSDQSKENESFYHLAGHELVHKVCAGLGCLAARELNPGRFQQAVSQWPPVYCLGKCYMAPASTDEDAEPLIEAHCTTSIVLAGMANNAIRSLSTYRAAGGYAALRKALAMEPSDVVAELEASKLRGRGGAGFPAGKKWRAVLSQPEPVKYVVANADEGDHGGYIDRFIIERTPHRLLEAMAIAGHAVGASKGYIYVRKEYPAARKALQAALLEAEQEGVLGTFQVEIVIGQGSYVCGEETALLNSIEHKRPEVRARPPYPFQQGLFGKPTLVNNVETLVNVPWILLHGGKSYAALGEGESRGTKAVSLNSLFVRPGLYEVEFGIPLSRIVYGIGGGLRTGSLKALMVGGPLAGLVRPEELETPFTFEAMQSIGAAVGHGGMVAFDASTSILEMLAHLFTFGAFESCGKCTPCRVGTREIEKLLWQAGAGCSLTEPERARLHTILDALAQTSLCGHGTGLAEVARSAFEKFPKEMAACFT